MTSEFGESLRRLRKARGWSLVQTAQAAGIARSTLSRWERGTYRPRLPELEATLFVLNPSPAQRRQILTLLDAPRTQILLQAEVTQTLQKTVQRLGMGPMPRGGDLLRALRLRRGVSLEDLALRLGVTTRTLRLWEKGEVWPSSSLIQSLCYFLGAREAEIVALTSLSYGRFSSPERTTETVADLEQQLEAVMLELFWDPSLSDLRFFFLGIQAWQLAARKPSGRHLFLLAKVYAQHANSLSAQKRFREAAAVAERALELLPETLKGGEKEQKAMRPHDPFWLFAGIAAARATVFRGEKPAPRRGIEQLQQWLPQARQPEYQAWILADMAEYHLLLGKESARESAVVLSEQASEIAARTEQRSFEVERNLRDLDRARILLGAHRPGDALALLDHLVLQFRESRRLSEIYLLAAQASLRLGLRSEAQDHFDRARNDSTLYGSASLQPQLEAMAERL